MSWKDNYTARNALINYINTLCQEGMDLAEAETVLCYALADIRGQILNIMAVRLREPTLDELIVPEESTNDQSTIDNRQSTVDSPQYEPDEFIPASEVPGMIPDEVLKGIEEDLEN